jgi:hypothetical protein
LGPAQEDWDYGLDLEIRREVRIDGPALVAELSIPDQARLLLAVLASTGAGSHGTVRWTAWKGTFLAIEGLHEQLSFKVTSRDIGSKLILETVLVLDQDVEPLSCLGATRRGSRLMIERQARTLLDGDGDRLPMVEREFSTSQHAHSPWRVLIDATPDLELSAVDQITVDLNSQLEWLRPALESRNDPIAATLRSQLAAQVARLVADVALDREEEFREYLERNEPQQDSPGDSRTLGDLARSYLELAYPPHVEPIQEAIRERREDRGRYEARFMSLFGEKSE